MFSKEKMSTENIKKLKKATREAPLNMGDQITDHFIYIYLIHPFQGL